MKFYQIFLLIKCENTIVSQFAKNRVNIEEIISCYRDTIIIVDEKDSTKGYSIVKNLTPEI